MEEVSLSPWELWGHSLGWALIGIAFVKCVVYPRQQKFKLGFWIRDNGLDVLTGLLLTLITIKLGDIIIDILSLVGIDLSGIKDAMNEAQMDPVQFSLVIAILFQSWIWKRKKKKKLNALGGITPPPPPPPPKDDDPDQ